MQSRIVALLLVIMMIWPSAIAAESGRATPNCLQQDISSIPGSIGIFCATRKHLQLIPKTTCSWFLRAPSYATSFPEGASSRLTTPVTEGRGQ